MVGEQINERFPDLLYLDMKDARIAEEDGLSTFIEHLSIIGGADEASQSEDAVNAYLQGQEATISTGNFTQPVESSADLGFRDFFDGSFP